MKTLTKHGNSYAYVIDKPIMDLLKIGPDTPLEISTDGQSLILTPADPKREKKFQRAMDQTVKQYGRMLKRLAQ